MPVTINASTSSGLVQSADNSGIIQFQSNGVTKATLNSSGFSYPGAVLQVIQATTSTQVTISGTTSWTDSGLSASITPTSATSKVLVLISQEFYNYRSTSAITSGIRLLRDSTVIQAPWADSGGPLEPYIQVDGGSSVYFAFRFPITYLDSPATTSSVTYKTQGALRDTANGQNLRFQQNSSPGTNGTSIIVLMEIAA